MLAPGTIVRHWTEVGRLWDDERWPNFGPDEFACPCCGELYWAPDVFDMVQAVRTTLGRGLTINSAHRCPIHNARVGGAPLSQHKKIALDLSLRGHQPKDLLAAARQAGFTTFGYYGTFLHVDCRPGRRWKTKAGARTWKSLLNF